MKEVGRFQVRLWLRKSRPWKNQRIPNVEQKAMTRDKRTPPMNTTDHRGAQGPSTHAVTAASSGCLGHSKWSTQCKCTPAGATVLTHSQHTKQMMCFQLLNSISFFPPSTRSFYMDVLQVPKVLLAESQPQLSHCTLNYIHLGHKLSIS